MAAACVLSFPSCSCASICDKLVPAEPLTLIPAQPYPGLSPCPGCALGSALQGNPGRYRGPESNLGAAAFPGEGILPPLAGRRYPSGAEPCQYRQAEAPSRSRTAAWKCCRVMLGPVGSRPPPALTQPRGTVLLLQPSEERVSMASLSCNFHRHPRGSCCCVS